MLKDSGVPFHYREYRKDPLAASEIEAMLQKLSLPASALLRKRDKAYAELGLSGDESDEVLVPHLAAHPTLMQRPIGILGERAELGRPPENLLRLVEESAS